MFCTLNKQTTDGLKCSSYHPNWCTSHWPDGGKAARVLTVMRCRVSHLMGAVSHINLRVMGGRHLPTMMQLPKEGQGGSSSSSLWASSWRIEKEERRRRGGGVRREEREEGRGERGGDEERWECGAKWGGAGCLLSSFCLFGLCFPPSSVWGEEKVSLRCVYTTLLILTLWICCQKHV